MSDQNQRGGIGFLGMLAILFIGLKLTGYVSWSWWWVLAPIWGGAAFVLVMTVVMLIFAITLKSMGKLK